MMKIKNGFQKHKICLAVVYDGGDDTSDIYIEWHIKLRFQAIEYKE